MATEFLSLCHVLFNIVSLASYFCDVVFDCVTVFSLHQRGQRYWFWVSLALVLGSLVLGQACSMAWHVRAARQGRRGGAWALLTLQHLLMAGVLARYFVLFMPVDLTHVRHEVRDLCVLRMLHGFCQAAPMLLLQLYLIWQKSSAAHLTDLNIVSTALSLFSVCWALASFNKNVRSRNVDRLVLTWLGVICQLAWRLGTVTSRCLALTVYATLYGHWMLLVIALHWVSMFLWLISPKNVFHGEKMPVLKKIGLSMLIAFCYIFCYINLQEINSRRKMIAFYLTMLLENSLLVSVWLGGLRVQPWYQHSVTAVVFSSFTLGIIFMLLYYKHFHVRRLQQQQQIGATTTAVYHCTGCRMEGCADRSHRMPFPYYLNELSASDNSTIASDARTVKVNNTTHKPFRNCGRLQYVTQDTLHVPGVFKCRFNAPIKRKKKKPTSFVPPPPASVLAALNFPNNASELTGLQQPPFWQQPLPQFACSDHEGSLGSRVNIQQKLQEKKQQQIAELQQIEEEIRSGKLKRPHPSDISDSGALPQPIPKAKKQPWVRPEPFRCPYILDNTANHSVPLAMNRSQTPEILLSPHYLENSRIYYEYQDPRWKYGNNYHLPSDGVSNSSRSRRSTPRRACKSPDKSLDLRDRDRVLYKSVRAPSDLDSQISLPRSYTLPREFKYYRRPKIRKVLRNDQFLTSTNSSDGDVDSCDEGGTLSDEPSYLPTSRALLQHLHHHHHNQQPQPLALQPHQHHHAVYHHHHPHHNIPTTAAATTTGGGVLNHPHHHQVRPQQQHPLPQQCSSPDRGPVQLNPLAHGTVQGYNNMAAPPNLHETKL